MPDRSRRVGRPEHYDEEDEGLSAFLPAQGIDIEVVAFYVRYIDTNARIEVDYQNDRKGYRISSSTIGINPEDVKAMIDDSKLFRQEKNGGYDGLYVESETARKRQREGRPPPPSGNRRGVRTNSQATESNTRPVPAATGYANQRYNEVPAPNTGRRTTEYSFPSARASQPQPQYSYDRRPTEPSYAAALPPRYGQQSTTTVPAPSDSRRPIFSQYETRDAGEDRNPTQPDPGATQGFSRPEYHGAPGYPNNSGSGRPRYQ